MQVVAPQLSCNSASAGGVQNLSVGQSRGMAQVRQLQEQEHTNCFLRAICQVLIPLSPLTHSHRHQLQHSQSRVSLTLPYKYPNLPGYKFFKANSIHIWKISFTTFFSKPFPISFKCICILNQNNQNSEADPSLKYLIYISL